MNDQLVTETPLVVASIAGATAATLANRSNDSRWRKLGEWGVMALVGINLGPAIAKWIGLTDQHSQVAVCFGIGACGMIILTGIFDAVKGLKIGDLVAKWLGAR